MMSSKDVFLSSTVMDDDLPPPLLNLIYTAAPSSYLDDFLIESNLLDLSNLDISQLDDNSTDDVLDELLADFEEAQAATFNAELPSSQQGSTPSFENEAASKLSKAPDLDPATVDGDSHHSPKNQSKTEEYQPMEATGSKPLVIKTSDSNVHSNLMNTTQLWRTGQSLRLRTFPNSNQRARYEQELQRDLRYISTPDNNCIDFEMFELRHHLPINTKVIMRVTRTTIPYGPNRIVYCHPYPLWVKDQHAKVHHRSLLIDITGQIMTNQRIKFEHLIMQRLKQGPLKKITQWAIYTSEQLDCSGFYSPNTNIAKDIIEHYNLRSSILHFQIFLVDENQVAYPTDLSCETSAIFEYEEKDRKNHPELFEVQRKHQTKRLQPKPITTPRKKRIQACKSG